MLIALDSKGREVRRIPCGERRFIRDPKEFAEPTAEERAAGFARSMAKWAQSGFKIHPKSFRGAWEVVCDSCEHWDAVAFLGLGKCKLCGCSGVKRKMATELCAKIRIPARTGRRQIRSKPPYRVVFASPNWYRGGLETVVINHILNMDRDKWQPIILTGITHEMDDSVPDGVPFLVEPEAFDWSFPPLKRESVIAHSRAMIERINPDVFIGQITDSIYSGAQAAGVPIIAEYWHNGEVWDQAEHPSDLAFAVSQWTALSVRSKRKLGIPFNVVHNGVDARLFYPDASARADVRSKLGVEGAKLVTYCGRISDEKQPITWVNALGSLAKIDPSVIGLVLGTFRCHDALWDAMQARAKELGVTLIHASCPYDQVRRYMCASDLLLHTARYETFGMSVVEAMFCQLPVVAFKVGGIAETSAIAGPEAITTAQVEDFDGLVRLAATRLQEPRKPYSASTVQSIARLSAGASTAKLCALLELAIAQAP